MSSKELFSFESTIRSVCFQFHLVAGQGACVLLVQTTDSTGDREERKSDMHTLITTAVFIK